MIIAIILYFICLFLYKNSRTRDGDLSILRVWHAILFGITTLIPFFGVIINIILIMVWIMLMFTEIKWAKTENKVFKFLNKEIK